MSFPHNIGGSWPAGVTIVDLPAPFALPETAGADLDLPYRQGLIPGVRTRKALDYPMLLRVRGTSEGEYNDRALALLAALTNADADGNPQPFTLGRNRPTVGGIVIETALARYEDGGQVVRRAAGGTYWMGTVLVVLRLLDGRWTTVGTTTP